MLSTCSEPRSNRNLVTLATSSLSRTPGLSCSEMQLVGAVDHRAGRVEQHDLVDRLDLARVEHDLLGVADGDALVASSAASIGGSTMSTPIGMSATPSALRISRDLARGGAEQAGVRGDGAAQADHPGVDVLRPQPRAVQAMVLGGRAEVPDVRIAAAGQQRVAGHLVARPLADVGARDVADVVEVEQQDGADVRRLERRRGRGRAGTSRRRSTFQRSSQSTFIEPGEANDVVIAASPVLGRLATGWQNVVH